MKPIHFYTWQHNEMVVPCGAEGDRTLSPAPEMVTCPQCQKALGLGQIWAAFDARHPNTI